MTSVHPKIYSLLVAILFSAGFFMATTQLTMAAPMTLVAEQPSRYFELLAKVEYLKAFLAALQEGEQSPAPTFVTTLSGDIVSLSGTLARTPNPDRMEICGPLGKGQVDWGDGVTESIRGLGCSGDVHTFGLHHRYAKSGSYKIRITDGEDRDTTHVVALRVKDSSDADEFQMTQNGSDVTVEGEITLDDAQPAACTETMIAALNWGDGSGELITCDQVDYSRTHSYATAGTYKLYVRDIDGDMTQRVINVK